MAALRDFGAVPALSTDGVGQPVVRRAGQAQLLGRAMATRLTCCAGVDPRRGHARDQRGEARSGPEASSARRHPSGPPPRPGSRQPSSLPGLRTAVRSRPAVRVRRLPSTRRRRSSVARRRPRLRWTRARSRQQRRRPRRPPVVRRHGLVLRRHSSVGEAARAHPIARLVSRPVERCLAAGVPAAAPGRRRLTGGRRPRRRTVRPLRRHVGARFGRPALHRLGPSVDGHVAGRRVRPSGRVAAPQEQRRRAAVAEPLRDLVRSGWR